MTHQVSPCSIWHKLISLEQDNLLQTETRTELEQHLAECEACRRFRLSLRQVGLVFKSSATASPRTDFTMLVMARVQAQPKPVAVRTLLVEPVPPRLWSNVPFMPHMPQVPLPRPAVFIGRIFVAVYAILVAGVLGIVFSNGILDMLGSIPDMFPQVLEGLQTARIMVLAFVDLLAATLTPETQFMISASFAVTMLGAALIIQLRHKNESQVTA